MVKNKIILSTIIGLSIIMTPCYASASTNVNKTDLNNGKYIIEELQTEAELLYRNFELIGPEEFTISMTNLYCYSGTRVTDLNKNRAGTRVIADETTVTIKSKTSDYEKVFHILNHEHSFEKVEIPATYSNYGRIYNVCSKCDAIKLVETIEKLKTVKTDILNGINKSNISWNSAGKVTGYEIWRSKDGEKYSFYLKTNETSLKVDSNSYYYKVRHFVNDDGVITYGNFSNSVLAKKATSINMKVNTKKVNGYIYSLVTDNKVQLRWDNIPDASYYVIYKSFSSNKDYKKYKTVKNYRYTNIEGISSNKTHYFKIRAYTSSGKYIESKPVKVTTFTKTSGYFYNKCIWNDAWNNILITSDKASTKTMNNYTVNGYKTYVKYNYSTKNKTLYIHNYITFEGPNVNSKFEYYKYKNGKYYKSQTSDYTYKTVALSGITKYWERTVTGDKYDFSPGVKFNVKVINHTSGFSSDQKVIKIKIGSKQSGNNYWFMTEGGSNGSGGIILATQKQLANNKNQLYHPEKNMDSYKNVVAHEYGHNLGLGDAYSITVNNKKIIRTTKNSEIGHYKNNEFLNIMNGNRTAYATDNDIEMILQAQGESDNTNGSRPKKQHYRTHYMPTNRGSLKQTKSIVIRK